MELTAKIEALKDALNYLHGEERIAFINEIKQQIQIIESAIDVIDKESSDADILYAELNGLSEITNDFHNSTCATGQIDIDNSKVVNGQMIQSTSKTIQAFDSLYHLREYLKTIPPAKASFHSSSLKIDGHIDFKIPVWIYDSEGRKLFFEYNQSAACPFQYQAIQQKAIPAETLSNEIFIWTITEKEDQTTTIYSIKAIRPLGVRDEFLKSQHIRDLSNDSLLNKITDEELNTTSAARLYELLQLAHPTDYGLKVSRGVLLREWEARGYELTQELGLPTNPLYPYINKYVLYTGIESVYEQLTDGAENASCWWGLHEHFIAIADLDAVSNQLNELIADNDALPKKKKGNGPAYSSFLNEEYEDGLSVIKNYRDAEKNKSGDDKNEKAGGLSSGEKNNTPFEVVGTGRWCPSQFKTNIGTQGIADLQITKLHFPDYFADVYVRENVKLPESGFAVSAPERMGMKTKGFLPKGSIQVLEIAAPLRIKNNGHVYGKIQKAIANADAMKRPVIENREFTIDWAEKKIGDKKLKRKSLGGEVKLPLKLFKGKDDGKLPKGAKEIFHYTEPEDLKDLENRKGGTWFTSNPFGYQRRAGVKGKIAKVIIPSELNLIPAKKIWLLGGGDWANGVKKAMENGFDGVTEMVDGDRHYLIFDISKTRSKNQFISESHDKEKQGE